jgi:bifunctional UDP-N-acetylglucosamine pyrophosphorylase/glucosamine-1-phosphate N-acetyltransferase
MPRLTTIVLAAGQGTRMKSKTPKVLHELCGRPMVAWPVEAARAAGADRVVVVQGPDRALEGRVPDGVELVVQPEPRGTGDAVRAAAHLVERDDVVVVLNGDSAVVTAHDVRALAAALGAGVDGALATMTLEDPRGYGRVVRGADGLVERVVETKVEADATPAELAIREVNAGLYAFSGGPLLDALGMLTPDNEQGEYYLPDVVRSLRATAPVTVPVASGLGVNDRVELAEVRAVLQRRILDGLAREHGVTVVDPGSTHVDVTVAIGQDTRLEPFTSLRGATRIGADCTIGPHVHVVDAELHDGVSLGPFAYLRPGAVLRARSKVGTFVEVKNSDIGEGTKVPHLSYVGDATIGPGTNVGAANVTANYDGRAKHRTTIGAGVRTGVDTTFVAPVSVGDRAWTAAGSVITEDVPAEALAVARARQRVVAGYARRKG